MKLNYKATNIAKAEDAYDLSFLGTIGKLGELGEQDFPDIRLGVIVFLLIAGGATEDEANELIDQGIDQAFEAIFEGLKTAGFLAMKQTTAQKRVKAIQKAK